MLIARLVNRRTALIFITLLALMITGAFVGRTTMSRGRLNVNPIVGATNRTYLATASASYTVVFTDQTVTNTDDSGSGSLREAIANVSVNGTINFDPMLIGQTITLTSGELVIDKNLTIQGPTTGALTISGDSTSRIFNVNAGVNFTFSNLTISGGQATTGGGVNNLGNLTILNSTLSGNTATSNGGAILTEGGVVRIINSTISGNNGGSGGGGLYNGGNSQTTITNSTIANNNEGIRHVSSNPLLLNNTIVARNPNCVSCDEVDVFVDAEVPTATIDPASSNNLIGVDTGVIGISNGVNGNQIGSAGAPVDPLLGPLANNGGPTFTHALNNLSPAADTGNNALAVDQNNAALTTDQRGTGFPRIDHGVVDIGAYEKTFVPPPPSADVAVSKFAGSEESLAGRDIVYTITVTNGGPDAAANVTLNDLLPGDLTFVSMPTPAGWACTTPSAGFGGTVNCTNPNLVVGSVVGFTLTVHIPASSSETEYHNVATVTTTTNDSNSVNDSSSANVTIVSCLTNPIVVSNADGGAGSLRQAIIDACDGSIITFDMNQVVSPITLTSGELLIDKNLTITGPGASLLTISGNTASRNFHVSSGTVTISGLTISQGLANASSSPANVGGGIYNSGNLTLNSCVVTANNAPVGGGIYNPIGGILNINNSTISGNTATAAGGGGGIANLNGGTLNLTNSTINGNIANGQGGGLLNQNSPAILINSTISGNTAGIGGDGGGILNSASSGGTATANLTNCTITGNTANRGSAIFTADLFNNAINAETLIGNSLVGSNNGPSFFTSGTQAKVTDHGNNLDSDGTSGLVNGTNGNKVGTTGSPLNALVAPLGDNGGPTQTHALLSGSPALDAGSNTAATNAGLTTDQRGAGSARIVDGPDADTTDTVDIGAFEAQVSVEDITDKVTNEDTQVQFTFNVVGEVNIISVTATSANTALVPNDVANIALSGSGSTRTLTINPAANQFGTSTITVTVNGANSQSMTDSFVLTVNAIAETPSVTNATTNEDTQTTSGLVISRNPADAAEVTHFKISGITSGALFKNDGATPINNGDFITFADGNAGLKFTPAANLFSPGTTFSFQVQGATSAVGAGLSASFATATITVNTVADTPSVTNATTNEDTQTTLGLVITRNSVDGAEVTHFKITGITNGALFKNDGATPINNGDFITFADGSAGLKFTPAANLFSPGTTFSFQVQGATSNTGTGLSSGFATATINVSPGADTPSVTNATTNEDTQTTLGLVITRNSVDGAEVTHFKISGITSGALFKNDGATPINNGDFITFADGNAGLKFTPAANLFSPSTSFSFQVQGATSAAGAGLSTSFATATITVNTVADTPSVTSATTNEDTQTTSGLVISRNAADGTEVTHFKVSGITNGALFKNNGTTPINSGDFITFAEGGAGLKFTPAANLFSPGTTFSFQVQGATSNTGTGLSPGFATANITVNPVADTTSVTNATTTVNAQTTSGLVISRNAADSAEVTNFKITNITNGTLFKNDGTTQINNNQFITIAEGNAGLKFTPALNSNAGGSFQVQASLSNTDAGLGGGLATATITVDCGPTVVTSSNDTGAGSLRSIINTACVGATITFDVNQVTSPLAFHGSDLVINKDLTIQGPGVSTLTVRGGGSARVFNIQSGATVTISDLTMSDGNTTVSTSGGNILNSGSLTLKNCNLYNGKTFNVGGAIQSSGPSLTLTNCNVGGTSAGQPNSAMVYGGIFMSAGTLTMTGGSISGNIGGGVFLSSGVTANLNSVAITGNSFNSSGGGVAIGSGATANITNSLFTNNSGNPGGALLNNGTATVTNSTFSNNTSLVIIPPTSTACGGTGGAIQNGGMLTMINDTVTNNRSGTSGGAGIRAGGTVILRNSIIAGNLDCAPSTTPNDISGTVDASSSFNLVGTGGAGGLTNGVNNNQVGVANALIGALANNGGSTQTNALLPGSPAINAGDNAAITNPPFSGPPFTDQRGTGFARIVNGTVDIGAFESRGFTISVSSGTPQSAIFNTAFGAPLLATLASAFGEPVNGGQVTFAAPGSGASATFTGGVTTINVAVAASGQASASATANATAGGPYNVTATGNGITGTANFALTNLKADQTITFNALANKTFGDPDFAVGAMTTSGLPVSFAAGGNCTVTSPSPGTVHITGAGTCTITASQAGDANYNPAANVPQSFTIAKAATTTSVSSSVNPSEFGQSVTFTATVTSGAGTPTGTVQFKDNGANLGAAVALNASGVAQLSTSSLTAGTHTITADYSGDTSFIASTGTLAGGQVVSPLPSLSVNDVSISEGDSGTKTLDFTVALSTASNLTITANYATANGTATAPSDYVATNGTLTFNPGQTTRTIQVTINGDIGLEPDEIFTLNLSNPVNTTISDNQGRGTMQNDDALGGFISFSQANTNVNESTGVVTLTVTRSVISFGQVHPEDDLPAVNVDYATDDTGASTNCAALNTGLASQRCDYTSVFGTLKFAANETEKTIDIPINLDAYTEGPEVFTVKLSNPTGGAVASPSTATVTINDSASPTPNAIDETINFVRQQYRDFLNREADAAGLAFWTDNIEKCKDPARRPANQTLAQCIEVQRIVTSAAFFLSIEFKQTGGTVRDFYVAALDRPATNNMPNFVEFMRDTQAIQKGVVVGQGNWQQVLDANRTAFMNEFVTRAEFVGLYPTTDTPAQYVDKLYLHAGVTPANSSERAAAIAEFGGAGTAADPGARGRALLRVTQNAAFQAREANRTFVQIEYFGYLRRDPDIAGYNFWVSKLNQFNGDFLQAEMVKAFLSSLEYRGRFGP